MHRHALLTLALLAALAVGGCGSGNSSSDSSAHSSEEQRTGTSASKPPGASLAPAGNPRYAAPPAGAPQGGATVAIAYREITIDPDSVKVKVGTTVRWTNYDPVEHNVTSQSGPTSFASGNFSEGHTFAVKFTKPGVYHYKCTIHPTTMNGTIDVVR